MIPDVHIAPSGWGIRPVLFTVAGRPVPSYAFFVTLGLAAAVALYFYNTRKREVGGQALYIAMAAVIGGVVGSKIPIWVANAGALVRDPGDVALWLSGRTIVGGLIGGVVAVWITKRRMGIKARLGNYLVPSLCLGILFGRIGCFLAGCCYGTASSLPWAVDFGDHVARHPTQLYEALIMLLFLAYAQLTLDDHAPGMLFVQFMVFYFAWRFLVEFVRVNPVAAVGLTYYQLVAAAIVVAYLARIAYRKADAAREGIR